MAAKIPGNGIDANGQETILDADADTSITADTDDQIDFKTGGTDRLTVQSTAGNNVVIADGLTLTNGNIAVASGHGISFAATGDTSSGSMGSELFDDYEEGSWTPTTSTGQGVASVLGARYTLVGNICTASFYVSLTAITSTATGAFYIGGLPFTSSNNSVYGGGSVGYAGATVFNDFTDPLVIPNGTYMYYHKNDGSGAFVTITEMNTLTTGAVPWLGQVIYEIDH
mgnify:CR=1 FL=1